MSVKVLRSLLPMIWKILRQNDFKGILKAGILFLLLLFSGFFLNLADTWLLQKMGQQIVYKLREETFTHIHSLSLSFSI